MGKIYEVLKKAEADKQLQSKILKASDQMIHAKRQPAKRSDGVSIMIEEYHRMKLLIQAARGEETIKALVFSSSQQSEGTSTVVINFAKAIASTGESVLLIDANLKRPSLHQAFNIEQNWGLSDLLQEKSSLSDVIKKTRIPNLSVITCGSPTHPNPQALFLADSTAVVLGRMKEQADWVLFDTPPLNSYNDAITLAARTDGVVLVLEAEKTRREVVQKVCERLEESGIRILGTVLNKRRMYIPDWAYNRL